MFILDKSPTGSAMLLELRDSLLRAEQLSTQLARQVENSSNEQITELHGVPAEAVAPYKTVLGDIVTTMSSGAIQALLGNVA